LDTPVCSTKKTERHDITEILLKVVLNTINLYAKCMLQLLFLAIDRRHEETRMN
jgi:hypothetical protein